MNTLLLALALLIAPVMPWNTDFKMAQQEAQKSNKLILINFSGSDWCGPCKRIKQEVFDSEPFNTYASEHLVLVNADFPRNKKNALSKAQLQKNEALAERYNPDGKFPLTILVDSSGQVLKTWVGLPQGGPNGFISDLHNTRP